MSVDEPKHLLKDYEAPKKAPAFKLAPAEKSGAVMVEEAIGRLTETSPAVGAAVGRVIERTFPNPPEVVGDAETEALLDIKRYDTFEKPPAAKQPAQKPPAPKK